MKHQIVIGISVIAIVASAVISNRAYDHYKIHQHIVATQQAAENFKREKLQQAAVAAEQRRINDECQKQTVDYNLLTPAQKAKVAAPACNLPVVQ